MRIENDPCPLCHSQHCEFYHQDTNRIYRQCQECDLVFVPSCFHLSASAEKAEYDKHDNTILDDGYRRFLNRTLEPVLAAVKQRFSGAEFDSVTGLDFGCGEGAFLSKMAAEHNLSAESNLSAKSNLSTRGDLSSRRKVNIDNYDLYYHPDESRLKQDYDFIVMTEVLEHLSAPDRILKGLAAQLNPGGFMAIMTKRVRDKDAFTTWHYKNDPTHICFYSEATFAYLARRYGFKIEIISSDVVLLCR